jgi:RimJ/RimL family protein N-acetyltransferase
MAREVPRIDGSAVILRPVEARDKADRKRCGTAAIFARGFGVFGAEDSVGTDGSAERWFHQWDDKETARVWAIEFDARCVGTVSLGEFEHPRRLRLGIGIFDTAVWGQGIGTEACRLAVKHAFEEADAHRVDLRVLASNVGAVRCYERAGFAIEGREREVLQDEDGIWHDDLIMAILRDEYFNAGRVERRQESSTGVEYDEV